MLNYGLRILGAPRSLLVIDTQGTISPHAGIRDASADVGLEIVGGKCVPAEMTAHIEAADIRPDINSWRGASSCRTLEPTTRASNPGAAHVACPAGLRRAQAFPRIRTWKVS